MKKIFYLLCLVGLVGIVYLQKSKQEDTPIKLLKSSSKLDKKTRADLALLHNYEMIKNPETGEVPRGELWKAVAYLQDMENMKMKATIPNVVWSERGPNNVGGRTRAIVFDPTDETSSRVFAASVSGGLWVCNNIYASETRWSPVNEFFDNLAITTIAFNPVNTDTVYFGTGEGYYNADAVRGDGIWRSTDGGGSWTQLSSTTSGSTFNYVQKIVVDSNGNVYAATRDGGIQKSTDHGNSWSKILGSGASASTNRAADLEMAQDGDLFVAMGIFSTDGVYHSTDSGSSWTKVYSASGEQRIELACSPSDPDYIYGLTQNSSNNEVRYIIRSTDGGVNWSQITPPTATDGVNNYGLARGQAWYDLSIAVDPNDETNLYIGGIDLHKSTNSGTTWTQVSHWYGGGGYPEVHADQHIVVYAPGNSDTVLFGHDGGIDLTKNATSSTPSFQHQVANYNVTQFYACAIHPDAGSNIFTAGSQDNGTHMYTDKGINSTTEVTGGDGAFTHIDQNDPNYIFTSYVFNQYRRSSNGGASFSTLNFSSSAGKFINPTDYDHDAEIMYCSYNTGSILRWPSARTGTSANTLSFGGGGEPSAIFCDPNTANRIYIGTDNGEIWRINGANGATPTATQLTSTGVSGYVSCIDLEDGDADHILATYSNYGVNSVWESTDGGSSWTSVEGDLPNMPVRWGMFDPRNSDRAFLATELGVWTTDNLNAGATSWTATNDGLANVRTDMLQWRSSDSTLIAATHGRGLYSATFSEKIDPDFTSDRQMVYLGDPVEFYDASSGATSWEWDINNDGIIDGTGKDISWQYTTPGFKTVKLIINGTDSITQTNFISVLPKLGTPYTAADGGDFESNTWHFGSETVFGNINLWEVGSPSNQISNTSSGSSVWKTKLDADIERGDYACALYSPSFNFTNTGTYTLNLDYRMEVRSTLVPVAVFCEYSDDNGVNWNKLGTYNSTNNWYSTASNWVYNSDCWSHTIGSYSSASVDVSFLAGNDDVRFRIMMLVEDGWESGGNPDILYEMDGFSLDDFTISGPSNDSISFDIATSMKDSTEKGIAANQEVIFITPSNDILAKVENLGNHDYGLTKVIIDTEGVGTMDFDTNNTTKSKILQKTLRIIPETNNPSGNYKVTLYFTEEEADEWKTTTGNYFKNITILKSPGSIKDGTVGNSVYGSNTIVDSTYNGSGLSICAEFSNGFSGFGAGLNGSSGPLPVQLISFTGQRRDQQNILEWATASELNSSHFEIQRLQNSGFRTLDWVQSNGTSNRVNRYSYIDLVPDQKSSSYRLKMVDLDGSYEYSKIITINESKDRIRDIRIYPSPTSDYLTILDENKEKEWSFSIMSVDLKVQESRERLFGDFTLNVSTFPEGTYFIVIREGARIVKTKKVVIVH